MNFTASALSEQPTMPRHGAGGYEKSQGGPVNYLESTQPCKMLTHVDLPP